jgi:hypothetical protein
LKAGSTTYYGGEQRVPLDIHAGPLAQPTLVIAYGTSSAPTPEQKVLQQLIGGETSVKWSHGSSALAQAAAKVNGASAKSFLLPYSDASLFGVVVTAPTSEGVAAVAKDVTAALKAASKASGEEIKRAIAKAKFADAISREQQLGLVQTAGPAVCPPILLSICSELTSSYSLETLPLLTLPSLLSKRSLPNLSERPLLIYSRQSPPSLPSVTCLSSLTRKLSVPRMRSKADKIAMNSTSRCCCSLKLNAYIRIHLARASVSTGVTTDCCLVGSAGC